MFIFSASNDQWAKRPIPARSLHTAVADGNNMIIYGGTGSSESDGTLVYYDEVWVYKYSNI
ncbi:MAG TPA: kelch repeat-containing protein [Candidatus Obscuribacterales bacterium]